jgi:hypothetical protein
MFPITRSHIWFLKRAFNGGWMLLQSLTRNWSGTPPVGRVCGKQKENRRMFQQGFDSFHSATKLLPKSSNFFWKIVSQPDKPWTVPELRKQQEDVLLFEGTETHEIVYGDKAGNALQLQWGLKAKVRPEEKALNIAICPQRVTFTSKSGSPDLFLL